MPADRHHGINLIGIGVRSIRVSWFLERDNSFSAWRLTADDAGPEVGLGEVCRCKSRSRPDLLEARFGRISEEPTIRSR